MIRRVIWAPKATSDLASQISRIKKTSPKNAALVRDRVHALVTRLAAVPTGRAGRVMGIYEAVVQKTALILAYELAESDTIAILRVIHGARDWKAGDWPEG